MNPNLLQNRVHQTINGSRRFEEASNFGSSLNSSNTASCKPSLITNQYLSLSKNNLHNNKSASVLEMKYEHEKERAKVRGKGVINTKACSRGHWRPTEDAKLKELVAQFGPQNWNLIAHHLPGRSGKSCRLRWFNQLDPRINKKAFTEEEEFRLLAAHRAYGNKWALISRLFPGRTDNAVKNHWHVIMARRTRESQRKRQQQAPPAPSREVEMTVSSSSRYNHGEFFGGVAEEYNFVNEEDDEEEDEDGSAASTCTTELSLTPPSLAHQPRFFNYDNTLFSGKDGQCVQRAEVNGKKMDHQNHHTITVSDRKMEMNMKSAFHFFDFLGVGPS